MKRQKEIPGSIFRVNLDEGYYTYGRILNNRDFAFYDCKTKEDIVNLETIITRPILFTAYVDSYAVKKGRWVIIGSLPLKGKSIESPSYYLPDVTNPDHHRMVDNGDIREATKEECIGLEIHAIWSPEQIEERINDYYKGVENEDLKILQRYSRGLLI